MIGAIFSVINAIDSYREYRRIRDEVREKIKKIKKEETYKKMDNDLKELHDQYEKALRGEE